MKKEQSEKANHDLKVPYELPCIVKELQLIIYSWPQAFNCTMLALADIRTYNCRSAHIDASY